MKSQLDRLKQYGKILEDYEKNALTMYEANSQRDEDLPFAITVLKEDFYRLFPEAREEEKHLIKKSDKELSNLIESKQYLTILKKGRQNPATK